jgi:hypothetical protein
MTTGNGIAPSDVAAADAADEAAVAEGGAEQPTERITLRTGIVLALVPLSPRAIRDAGDRLPRPQVPMVWNESKQKDEENPDHPQYKADVQQWQFETTEASLKFAVALGTRPEFIPDDRYGHDDDRWIEEIEQVHEVLGQTPPPLRREGKGRYLDWVLWYAVGSDEDNFKLSRILLATTVPTEEEVMRALNAFRHTASRLRAIDLAIAGSG